MRCDKQNHNQAVAKGERVSFVERMHPFNMSRGGRRLPLMRSGARATIMVHGSIARRPLTSVGGRQTVAANARYALSAQFAALAVEEWYQR